MFNMDDQVKKKLSDIDFVESASTNIDTQTVLLESLETSEHMKGRFKTANDMFIHIQQEWDNE